MKKLGLICLILLFVATAFALDFTPAGNINMMGDLNIWNVRDINGFHDINWAGGIKAAAFFGNGSGLTGLSAVSDGFTATMDVNALERAYLFGLDWNSALERIADLNLFFYRKTDINAGWYGIVDVNRNFLSIIDANLWYYKKTDVNANFYGKLDVNNAFVPYIGAVRDVNLGIKGLVSGDANIGSVQYWEITQKDVGGGIMYPALIPHGDAGKYGLIEGGLTISAPSGAADVVLGLYDSTFANSWFFTHNIADGLFSLGKNGTTAPFFINSKTSIAGDFNATGDVNIAEDLNVAGSVKATAFFGNGAGLTGVTGTTNWADLNAHLVPYIDADFDVNLGGNGLTAWDGNYRTLEADYLFGDGSGLTGLAEAQDVNSHFVPYIGADFDVNLNFHDLNARSISANRFFGAGDWNRADINVGKLWLGGNWIGFNNQFGSTLYVGNDSPTSETLIFWTGVVGGINSTLIYQFGGGALAKLYSLNDVNIDLGYDIRPFGELWLAEDANLSRAIKVNGAIFGNTSVKIGNDLNLLTKKVVSDVNISSGINKGVSIDADMNRICFPANSCEFSLDYNGTAFVFGS